MKPPDKTAPVVRKAAFAGFSWLFGLMLAGRTHPGIIAAAVIFVISVAAVFSLWGRRTALLCAVCAVVGFSYMSIYRLNVYQPIISLAGSEIHFTGRIIAADGYSTDTAGYEAVGRINGVHRAHIIIYHSQGEYDIGDFVSASGKASAFRDSYAFPAHEYYRSKGIFLRMSAASFDVTPYSGFSVRRAADDCVRYAARVIKDTLTGEEGDMLCAMLSGDKTVLESSTKTKLYRAGCGHIMAVSGIHLTVIYAALSALLKMTGLFDRKTVFLICVPFLLFFCFMAGLTPSVIRAAIMLMLPAPAFYIGRRADVMNTLGIAAVILTAGMPYAVYDSGLLLSFAGVIGISTVSPRIFERLAEHIPEKRTVRDIAGAAVSAFGVSITVFPFTLFIFDEAALISPVTNILVLPLCMAALVTGAAGAVTGGIAVISKPLLIISGALCRPVLAWADIVSRADVLFIPSDRDAVRYISAALCFSAAALLMFHKDIIRAAAVSVSVIMAGYIAVTAMRILPTDKVSFVFLNDTSSAAAVIHNGHTASVIDIYGSGKAADMCGKYLRRKGISGIDMIYMDKKPLSAYPVYRNEFAGCDTAAAVCGDDSAAVGDDIMQIGCGTSLDAGYYVMTRGSGGELLFDIGGESFAVFSGDAEYDEELMFAAVSKKAENVRIVSEYISVYPDDVCTEFISDGKTTRARVISGGGSE